MKSSLKQALALALGCAALMSIHPSAFAVWNYDTLHGTACRPVDAQRSGISATTTGIRNSSLVAMTVLCPVIRTVAVETIGYRVYVNGSGLVNACRLYSQSHTGNPLWSALMTGADSGRRVTAVLPGDSPTQSSQVIECKLPPAGAIYSLEYVQ
jgi:hypothetical protein